ncbi:3-hydroxybutyryl-CoA dehydrogenase [Calderihabitans maritimus]|uniref:3-hydroxybutyryl-CoA dehydrogenase n=1 Tax=Calderihabitans maritimus TaxID=1246530 RepID=A0A1Z5HTW8_9FIRM|nr:3-hydroxybutyryl-CoA dehydrogenase [Calderihabitans maritimus]GAW92972.1 Probable 3-hydroxybutyryl-CoA dehydrogenase [Calderihabitans maritimus]
MGIQTIGIIGAGQMGSGIAQVAASKGFKVILNDINEEILQGSLKTISKHIQRSVDKNKISAADKDQILERIRTTTSLEEFKEVDFVVEAATEKVQLKLDLFRRLDQICSPDVILATNTSSISITLIATATTRRDKVIGMHFMNPVPVMRLVEVIRGFETSDETYQTVVQLAKELGKVPSEANDYPGFVANRILMPMINEAIYALYEGVATKESIDTIMKLGTNQPMGPLELADLIGLDTCLAIMEVLYEGFSDSKYRPCPLLRKMVTAGYLGRKVGKGFYEY